MEGSIIAPLANQSTPMDHIRESISFNQIQTTSPLQPVNPPTYPCSERCIKCNKSMANQSTVNGDLVVNSESEQIEQCECECHKQDPETQQLQTQIPKDNVEDVQNQVLQNPLQNQMTANHIPPAGPNCLQGCGYSGLPCYNCSMGPTPGPPGTSQTPSSISIHQGFFRTTDSPRPNPGYPVQPQGYPQIYTVDLMNNSRMNQDGLSQTQVLIAEEQGRRSRKRYCLSIIVSVIAINIAIAFFRMMIRGTVSRY